MFDVILRGSIVRTTITIDDDVLAAARALSERDGRSLGAVISALARESLRPQAGAGSNRNGLPLLPTRKESRPVTLELVNQLRDESP
jgi:hypothetical protein